MEKTRQQSVDLVDFQRRLNASLESMQSLGELSSLLGFSSAGKLWLVNLDDLHEIDALPLPEKTQRLGLAKPWVLGISNFKGNIYTLVDFQMFLGQNVTSAGLSSRTLLLHPKHQIQMALIVGEVAGLIPANEVKRFKTGGDWSWVTGEYKSSDGRVWNMIDVSALSSGEEMLNIAA